MSGFHRNENDGNDAPKRPTIREAMRMLEREGYIKIYSGSSGAVVQELNVDNAVQSLETIIQMKGMTIEEILEFDV